MKKTLSILKSSYIWIIISAFYLPIFFMTIFSFNKQGNKERISWNSWNGFSWNSWKELGDLSIGYAFLNSFIIGFAVALFTTLIALVTVFGLWRQKKGLKTAVSTTSNIPLINPDIVTALMLSITLSILFGTLNISKEGMMRVIISHIVMILPYSILFLYPRSEKFDKSLLEASQDLGFNRFWSWIKVYVLFMLPVLVIAFSAALTLSFDDFILTRLTSNVSTIGTLLYAGNFKGWGLALGAILLFFLISIVTIIIILQKLQIKRSKKRLKKIKVKSILNYEK